ncbi:carbohydrate ABC transporter permease [Subtercola sp. YIM 133946]|uniref:carbohydrate ABC transporter permease n=1 Tax=Subtercola sp. YIM 133946 TaxID=3118909 RepID=UPI002F9381C4
MAVVTNMNTDQALGSDRALKGQRGRGSAGAGDHSGPRRRKALVNYGYWWWALPAIVLVLVVVYVTTASGAFFAFTDWTGIGKFNFVGLANFQKIFSTPALSGALWHTLFLAAGFVIFTNVFGLSFALAVNRMLKTRYLLRVLLFMPVVLSPIAVSYIFAFIFAYKGPLNALLAGVGLSNLQQDWLANPTSAILSVLFVMVWQSIGLVMVVYLAGLASVPIELEEASALDGAGVFSRFRHITLPMIQPSIAIASTLMLVQGLRVFDQIMALTGGGPFGATETLATQIYKQSFTFGRYGFGAALALVLTVIILIFAIGQQLAMRSRDQVGK